MTRFTDLIYEIVNVYNEGSWLDLGVYERSV